MSRIPVRQITALLLLAWAVSGFGLSTGSRVLCVGQDGHLAIEFSHNGKSCAEMSADGSAPTCVQDESDCTDMPLPTIAEVTPTRNGRGLVADIRMSIVHASADPADRERASSIWPPARPRPDTHGLQILRTVVLLI
jgi:hypothetical protein